MTGRTYRFLALAGLAVSGCDRAPDPPRGEPAVTARSIEQVPAPPLGKPAPRSIRQPAIAAPPPAPPPPPAIVTIPFASPGHNLTDAQKALLDQLAAQLAGTKDHAIIRGSTDSHGGDRRNRLVSRLRARLVADYLAGRGIARDRLTIVALGEDRPIAPNAGLDGRDDPAGRARNRRVEVETIPADRASPLAVRDEPPGG